MDLVDPSFAPVEVSTGAGFQVRSKTLVVSHSNGRKGETVFGRR